MIRVLKNGGSLVLCAPNLEMPFCFPSAFRHKGVFFRTKFYSWRLYDYILRIFGRHRFRVVEDNYLKTTGIYEKIDDDLVYLVSSYEVISFLRSKDFKIIHADILNAGSSVKDKIKKMLTYLPAMRYYGTELFVIAQK